MSTYNHKEIESKWQKVWEKNKTSHATDDAKKKKKYVLIEFPYPSGEGLHMGHLRPYLAGDIYSRFQRMQGHNTMFPIGWDAFGLPAENYAIKKGVHPTVSTAKNIENAKRQLQSWGMGFDWDREINTTDPEYYRWTQWIFLQFFKAGLAYEATGLINWCPKDKTGLANEEVVDGKCERCGTVVEKKELRQWYLKITAYAEKLLEGLKDLNWPDKVKIQQANWIGRSEGAEIEFEIATDSKPNFLILHGYTGLVTGEFIPWLKKELENNGFEVQTPQLPNTETPKEAEQVQFVLDNCEINENTVIVGHSLGAVVAMKTIEKLNKKIKGLVTAGSATLEEFGGKERPWWPNFSKTVDFDAIKKFTEFRTVLSDLGEEDIEFRAGYQRQLSKSLDARLVETRSQEVHFCGKQEPTILDVVLPKIKVFTTRPDTLFGVTYMVLAPEHSLVERITTDEQKKDVDAYVDVSKNKSEQDRTNHEKEKTGVFTGAYAINPATKEKIPVWIADYVLATYGTGAIMAVPAHDERDFEFAKKFSLPIKQVITPSNSPFQGENNSVAVPPLKGEVRRGNSGVYFGEGELINSGEYDGMDSEKAKVEIANKFGKLKTQYKLRDWVFSRQRYWGEPIPLVHCEKCGVVPVPDDELPVKLPEVEKYEPTGTGESPLAAIADWVNVKCPKCESFARRETNTMPQWAGSSWYWLRYADPHNKKEFADKKLLKHWTPVDVYFGGMEHTTLHLLYARFWNLFLYDQGHVTAKEPFLKRVPHGIILGPDGEKMSKSRGNVINPDEIVEKYGADVLRMYEPFLGPHESTVPWSDKGIVGVQRFLDKVWKFEPKGEDNKNIHKLIKKVTADIQNFKFNTAIAAFMEFLNENKEMSKDNWETFLILLAPFAPHITEELWNKLGHADSIHAQPWPKFDEALTKDETVKIVVQISGKTRGTVELIAGSGQSEAKEKALADANIQKHLDGKEIVKEVFVQDRLINFVVR